MMMRWKRKGTSVEASDDKLGSPLELLQKEAAVDNNSDGGLGIKDADEESETSDDNAEGKSSDEGDEDDDAASRHDGTDNDASVADLQLEDPSTAESNIWKYLEDVRLRLRGEPALRRPTAVKRTAMAPDQTQCQVPSATD